MPGKHMKDPNTQVQASASQAPEPTHSRQAQVADAPQRRDDAAARRRKTRRIASTVLIVLGVILLAVAGGMWGYAQYRYWAQDQVNREQQKHVTIYESTAEEDPASEAPVVDWAALKAESDDIVGWIYVPDTVINYPVYQGDDNEFYLRHTYAGEWTVGGQVFLDCDNKAPGLVDYQSILYGHHLSDGTMFQPISMLDDQALFDKTETIWYCTEAGAYELEPLMLYYTQPEDENVRKFEFTSESEFHTYLKALLDTKAQTMRTDAEALIPRVKHVLTLSTCNYIGGYGRSELVCVLKNEVDPSLAKPTATTLTTPESGQEATGEGEEQAVEGEYVEGEGTEGEYTEGGEYSEEAQEGEENW